MNTDRDFWRPERHPRGSWLWLIVIIILGTAALICFAGYAWAHDPSGKYTAWLMEQTNQNNGSCCDGTDSIFLEDDQWRIAGDHYQVFYAASWHDVPSWALTQSKENITGKAVLWLWAGRPQCFKPGYLS
jgi:hypothetical protein